MSKTGNREFNKVRRQYGKLEDGAVLAIRKLMEEFRIQLAAKFATVDWTVHDLNEVKVIVNSLARNFSNAAKNELYEKMEKAFMKGIRQVDDVLFATGANVVLPYMTMNVLQLSQSLAAELITGLSADMAKQVNTQVQLGLMGQKTPYDVMKSLETFIPPLKSKKYIGSAVARAENIVRTEMARTSNNANWERIKEVGEKNPDAGKKWLATHKKNSRPAHQAMESLGVVPIDYEYSVNGYDCNGPHDPRLPASETCQCGCTLRMAVLENEDTKKTSHFLGGQ
ncbi:MAG TPA: hypothetical protein VMV56_07655 [Williamwhitmania sp.]|nr:hypothetical protein [Williamwhitmania sp.]